MRSGRLLVVVAAGTLAAACGGTSAPGRSTPPGGNLVPVTVNGALCTNSSSYPNKPCVSVTVCVPGTSQCTQVRDLLLDTGSSGLRIFHDALNGLDLPQVRAGSADLFGCAQFGDGTSDWGPVQVADVVLASEPAVTVPIQVIDWTLGTSSLPSGCRNADKSPADAGFNGILGVGVLAQDCGDLCAASAIGIYYACTGGSCGAIRVPIGSQVQNPVAHLPDDNNGVIVQLPAVPIGGAPSATGQLVLGIGTQANNAPAAGAARYDIQVDPSGNAFDVSTSFGGQPYQGFLDTGSNGFFFTDAQLPNCASQASWFCQTPTLPLSATNTGPNGSPSSAVSFNIGNFEALVLSPSSSNAVFSELGGTSPDFTWGLPFHLGRTVYVGIEGKVSSLGTGPYVAY